jgi:hypothetical protein
MKTLGQLHVFGVAKLVMVVLFDYNFIQKDYKNNKNE